MPGLMNDATMDSRQALLESLAAVADAGAVQLDDDRYIDFSVESEGKRMFEVGDGQGTVQLELTRAEMLQLHAALTRTLIEGP